MSNRLSRIAGFTVLTGVTVVSQSGIAHAADLTETTTDSNAVAGTPGDHIETLATKYDTSTLVKSVVKTAAVTAAATDSTVTASHYNEQEAPKTDDWKKTEEPKIEVVNNNDDDDKAECPTDGRSKLDNYSFTINGVGGFKTLDGNVKPGDTVKADFEVLDGCDDVELSLAAYDAPSGDFLDSEADKQVLSSSKTGKFTGKGSLEVTVPKCFYQVDFVNGPVLTKLGPAGSTNFYGERLIDFENGGEECIAPPPPVVVTPPVEAPPVVESVQLAHTGTDTSSYAALGAAMLMMGFAMDRTSRRMRKNRQARIDRNNQLLASAFGLN